MIEDNRKKLHILLIEDNPMDTILMSEVLTESENYSYEISSVIDGQEALEFLHNENEYKDVCRPDVILLDLDLPRMGGFDFLEKIQKDEKLHGIPVLIITTSSTKEDMLKAKKMEVRYLIKPLDLTHFEKVLAELGLGV